MDRFSLPDQSAVIRGHAEEGIKSEWEDIHHPEETDSPDAVSVKERIRGGGVGSEDIYQEDPQNMDPEYIHLKKEYMDAQEKGEVKSFEDWLNNNEVEIKKEKELTPEHNEKTSERVEVDKEGFHLGINRPNLVRKADKRDRGAVEDFWGYWVKTKNLDRSDIEAIGFGVQGKKISTVIMQLKDNSSITIPAPVFRTVFDGVRPYHDKATGDVTGFEFKNLKGWKGFIHPQTPQGKLDGVMKKMHMNGNPLPDNTRFFITSYEERIPVEFPWKEPQRVPAEV